MYEQFQHPIRSTIHNKPRPKPDGTPLYDARGDTYPRSLEYATKCIMVVEWWLHKHGGTLDELLGRLGLGKEG